MMKQFMSIALVLLLAVTFGCKKQEAEQAAEEPTSMEQAAPEAAPADAQAQPDAGAAAPEAQAGQ